MSDTPQDKPSDKPSMHNGYGQRAKLTGPVNGRRGRTNVLPPPTVNVKFVLHAMRQWWPIAAPLGLVLAATAGLVVWLLFEPVYRGEAYIQIKDRTPFAAFGTGSDSLSNAQNQIELVQTPPVLNAILANEEIAKLKEVSEAEYKHDWLRERTRVKQVGKTDVFVLSFEGPNPKNAAAIATAYVQVLIKQQQDQENLERTDRIDILKKQKNSRRAEVEGIQAQMTSIAKQVIVDKPISFDPRRELFSPQTALGRLYERKTDAEFDLALADAQLESLKKMQNDEELTPPRNLIEEALLASPEIRDLAARIEQNRAKLAGYEGAARTDAAQPTLIQARKRLEALISADQAQLKELQEKMEPRIVEQMQTSIQTHSKEWIKQANSEIENQRQYITLLDKEIKKEKDQVDAISGKSLELEFLRADLKLAQDVHERLHTYVARLESEAGSPQALSWWDVKNPGVQIPLRPVVAIPYPRIGAAGGAAFCLPFILAVFWERRVRRIADSQQISKELNLAVVGEITTLPMRSIMPSWGSADRFERHRSTFEESIDCLRTSLMLADDLQDLQVLVVASAASREGKTSLAAQLAVNLANCSRQPTLLIDGDMRDPDLHDMFGIPLEPGLAEVLDQRCTAAEAINSGWSKRIHLMPAGRLMKNPHTLLANGIFESTLSELRKKYRYIVIDSPPVLAASEALFVARAGDGTLLCTMRDVSRTPQLKLACDRLIDAGANVLGAVLSGIPPRSYAYKYGGSDAYARRYALNQATLANGHSVPPTEPRPDVDDYGRDSRS